MGGSESWVIPDAGAPNKNSTNKPRALMKPSFSRERGNVVAERTGLLA